MKWIICFSLMIGSAFSESIYQKHVPKDVYDYFLQKELIDESSFKIAKEIKTKETIDRLTLSIEKNQDQYVLIDYQLGQIVNQRSGVQLAYQKGKIIAYVVFDEKGRDYLAFPPFSQEDEAELTSDLLNLMERREHL